MSRKLSLSLSFPRFCTWLLALSAAALLGACATMMGGPRDVELPLSKLQQSLDKRFPVNQRVLEMFDINLTHPHLALQPEQERIAVNIATAIGSPLGGQPWNGNLAVSGRLVLDKERGAVVLREPRLDRLAADGMDETRQRLFSRVGTLVADRVIKDVVLYTFRPEELRYAGVQFEPIALRMRADALLITFAPVK